EDSDTAFVESVYYAYYVEGGKLVLERFEGDKDNLARVSVETRSTILHKGHVAQKTELKDPDNKITISTTFTWKQTKDQAGKDTNFIYTVTESYAQEYKDSNSLLLTTEYSRRMTKEETAGLTGIVGAATLTEVYEVGVKTSVRVNYRIKGVPASLQADLKAGEKTLISITRIWEAGFDIAKDQPTSTIYTYKVVEKIDNKDRLVTYTDTFVGDVFDTRQKTYYAEKTIKDKSIKVVQVAESWIGNNIALESFSYTYWKENVLTAEGHKTVKLTENYLDLNGNNTIEDSDTAFVESVYYAYYVDEAEAAKLILERFEGSKSDLVRVSIEKRSTKLYKDRVATLSEQMDPVDGKIAISLSYTWKQQGGYKGEDSGKVVTVTETLVKGSRDDYTDAILLTTEYSHREMNDNAIGKLSTIIKIRETDSYILTSIRETYKVKADDRSLPEGLKNDKFPVTITKIWETGLDTWSYKAGSSDYDSIIYTYKAVDPELGVVTYTDTFLRLDRNKLQKEDTFDTRQKSYYRWVATSTGGDRTVKVTENYENGISEAVLTTYAYYSIREINGGTRKAVEVVENMVGLGGGKTFTETVQYIYHTQSQAIGAKRAVTVIETYEGIFTSRDMSGSFLTDIQYEFSIAEDGKAKKVTQHFDPLMMDTPLYALYSYK
ncbi:MAG: hypothetical protein AAB267_01945, partial [Candidatus Desantisbacteria bacterium]